MPILVTEISIRRKALQYKMNTALTVLMIGRAPLVILDFDEIKHYFKTGEHLAKPTVIDRVEAVRNHLTWAMD
jgi:tRNA-dihydrouridine synthase